MCKIPNMHPLSFSVILCTRGRPGSLERTLRGTALLRYPTFELIVIRDPADAKTAQCLAELAQTAHIGDCTAANLAQARNIGVRMARGDILAFLDDDAVPEPDWLNQLAAYYRDPGVAAVGGFIRNRSGVRFQSRITLVDEFGADHHRRQIPRRLPSGWFLSPTGTNFSVRRAIALEIGAFDENYFYFLEESDFFWRLQQSGKRVCFAPEAEVHHGLAASAQRSPEGAPLSLHKIARSKAYFCAVNRRPLTPESAIASALGRFMRGRRRKILAHKHAGRLATADVTRLLGELRAGLAEGVALAGQGRALPLLPAPAATPVATRHGEPERVKLCVLFRGDPLAGPFGPALRALVAAGHEVTLIGLDKGLAPSVQFTGGLWVHRLPLWWRAVPGGEILALHSEMRRMAARRDFTHIYATTATPALQRLMAQSGLKPWPPAPQ